MLITLHDDSVAIRFVLRRMARASYVTSCPSCRTAGFGRLGLHDLQHPWFALMRKIIERGRKKEGKRERERERWH